MNLTHEITQQATNYTNPGSLGSKLRAKRIAPLIAMIQHTYEREGKVDIVDVGGTQAYWTILPKEVLQQNRVKITVVNLPNSQLPLNQEHFQFVHGDGCNLHEFSDNSFHIAHSNSVVEHVGDWHHMINFAAEIRRLAPKLFIQTPYFWFPIEPHFMTPCFHWLPRPMRISLLMRFDLGNHQRATCVSQAAARLERYRLLDKQMLQALFPDTTIHHETLWGLTKSLIALRA